MSDELGNPTSFTVAIALGNGDPTEYDVDFTPARRNEKHASFLFGISDASGGIASYSPVNGWVAWEGDQIAIAWSYEEGFGVGGTVLTKDVLGDDGEVDWEALASVVASTIMGA